jgi:hypothetical protein
VPEDRARIFRSRGADRAAVRAVAARLTESKKTAARLIAYGGRGHFPAFCFAKQQTKFRHRSREKYGRVAEDLVALLSPCTAIAPGSPNGPNQAAIPAASSFKGHIMTNSDHEKLISDAMHLVREELAANGRLEFTVLAIDEQGRSGRFLVDPDFLRSGHTKDRLVLELREAFRAKGVVRYVLIIEAWMDRKLPIPPGPLSGEAFHAYMAHYADDYQRRGLSPSIGGGRHEIIMMHVCDRKHSTVRLWTMQRDPATGAVRDLVPFDLEGDFNTLGRFVNLLEGTTH